MVQGVLAGVPRSHPGLSIDDLPLVNAPKAGSCPENGVKYLPKTN